MMSTPISAGIDREKSAANLRVTFWGVQGSCPIFPTLAEVADFSQRIAASMVTRTLADVANRLEREGCTAQAIRDLASPENSADYLERLGPPVLPVYGGDTTCIEVLTGDGDTLLFDMGTGLRDFSKHATAHWEGRGERILHVFGSHEHLDHRSGLPFATIGFEKKNPFTIHIYGTRKFLLALDDRYGIYSHKLTPAMHVDDPLDYRMLSATFTGSEIRTSASTGQPPDQFTSPVRQVGHAIKVGATSVTPFEVYHGVTECLGYKVTHGGSTFVFCTDHELRHGDDPADPRQIRSLKAERRVIQQCHNADVVYFDGQYLKEEYFGSKAIGSGPAISRMDWGHSCVEDVVDRVERCHIRRAFIGHHDPDRTWGSRVELDQRLEQLCEGTPYKIELAKSGQTIEL
jgi:ribonuclease BN (tRNA processing enzyme)